ncbi:putative long-chain fatty-acid CoA ligase [Halobacteriovorax marinus SJ]|uniref:Long-chain fatty-acid CoA ligase n=1 Tax=Halobacteriovorax marinus (strain ATCC BAA-682 / DSM 15412 / SJ) TaxID=862908 RepID=E1X2D0_HALMS|nr:long-chain fatty acid--CoA ligase [Halobacteriovorax marinus]CBW25086.1 putative long-chain fatty-acid CoA ligase [Halobacteriovorax marinus SJ]
MTIKRNIPALLLHKYKTNSQSKSIGWIKNGKVTTLNTHEYYECIAKIATALEEVGLRSNDKVSILADTSHIWHLYDLSCLCLNATVVPIYPTYTDEEAEYIVNHSESNVLVIDSEKQLSKISNVISQLTTLKTLIILTEIKNQELIQKCSKYTKIYTHTELLEKGKLITLDKPNRLEELIDSVQDNSLASIVYTSGTTGQPKGAMIRHNAFWSMLQNVKSGLGHNINESDRLLTFLPLSHVLGRCDSMLNLSLGIENIYAESIDKLVDNISVAQPTVMISVPRIFEKIYSKTQDTIEKESFIKKKLFSWAESISGEYFDYLDRDQSPPSKVLIARNLAYQTVFSKIYNRFGGKIRFFVSGGAPLGVDIIKFLRCANLTVLEGYGLTETIAPCCVNPVSKQMPGTVGLPLGDTQFQFDDDGEILVKSSGLFSGYYKNEEETQKAFKDGWFRTGDIGSLNSSGYLQITDRKKDIIITSGGKNVAPQKIENLLKIRKYITHFMVVGDKRKFLTGVVGIEKESFLEVLPALDLPSNVDIEELSKNQGVINLIKEDIESVNKELASFETIKKFYIAPIEFTPESGLITPSLKLKKKEILKRFDKEIDALYN